MHITLFSLSLVLVIVLLPISRRQIYHELKDDCFNHGIWIYDRMFENDEAVDLAFFGSSHTINGIDDQLIDSLTDLNTANFGYCRLGMNLNQILIEDLLKKKKPKVIFLEVREKEDRYSHPVYPNLASTGQVVFAYPFFNRDFLKDIHSHLSYKLQLLQDLSFGKYSQSKPTAENHGVASSPDTAAVQTLYEAKTNRKNDFKVQGTFAKNFYMEFPRHYLKNIADRLKQEEIKIVFLYLPSFGSVEKHPELLSDYKKYGDVWIAPWDIFEETDNWFDQDHLNSSGARKYSEWLSKKITSQFHKQ